MFKFKFFIAIIIFSSSLLVTSFIKNQSRELEKRIYNIRNEIFYLEKDINESQLDFYYLTSPLLIEEKIQHLDKNQYLPMEYSKIFLSMSNFIELQNKVVDQESYYGKKIQKK